jgi:hypothetical protein
MRASERSKLTTVMMFLSGPHVFEIALGDHQHTEPCPDHSTDKGLASLAQLSLRGDSITDGTNPQQSLTPAGNLLQPSKYFLEQAQVRVALGKRDPHLAHRHFNLGTDLEQPEPNRIALSLSQLGPLKSPPPQCLHHDVSER